MTTVREAVRLLRHAEHIYLTFNGCDRELCFPSDFEMDAFGSYIVSAIYSYPDKEGREFELEIEPSGYKTRPPRRVHPRRRR